MLFTRDILEKIKKAVNREEFVILTGARQSGKTSILIMLKEHLDQTGKPCHYFNLENPDHLKLFNKHPFNLFELIPSSKEKQYIFIDEVQYLNDPTNFLKLLYDEKRQEIKIFASGSSAFYIDKKFKDSLVGRKLLFELFTLNFKEFLTFKKQEELLQQKKSSIYYKKKILVLWNEYIKYGGYPKVVLAENKETKKIMLEEIGSSYIKKDALDAGIKNTDKYFALLKILAEQTGQLVNSQELANTLNIAHKTVEEYLYIMKKSYQIAFIKPFYKNLRKELTKMPKIYFFDLGLRNFFLNDYSSIPKGTNKGAYLENIAFREFLNETNNVDKIKFWRTQDKNEIDFIVKNKAFEIKFDAKKLKQKKYEKFTKKYPKIKLEMITNNNILSKFYGWKI